MTFNHLHKMPTVEEITRDIPLPADLKKLKEERDKEIRMVITGESDKMVMIIGPCSADNEDAVCDYISRLAGLQQLVKDKILLIPRIYTNKPRTTGEGYKGMAHQPDLGRDPDVVEGLKAIRRMHIRSLRESYLPAADEMLYPMNYGYLADVLSYVAVGARSVENQQHRLVCSGLDIPVGMKNPTSGDLEVMLNSVRASQLPHVFVYSEWAVETPGNPLTHAVLRGSYNRYARHDPNYHYEDLMGLAEGYLKRGLENPAIIVDTNHSNSAKMYQEQPRIAREVMDSRRYSPLLKTLIKGFMVESYIEEGSQGVSDNVYGKSITDPCLGWNDSEKLVMDIAGMV
jgi:3-deoxy-7-phosphoheptulonate synthase